MNTMTIFPRGRVTIVAVLNLTPDSFSDGGRFVGPRERVDVEAAVDAAAGMLRDGADVIDVGGESTRPGAPEVPVATELSRTIPVIEALSKRFAVPLSIDTRKAEVAEAAVAAGAEIVNDVSGLGFEPELADVVARTDALLVVGHQRGTPETMQQRPHYDDCLAEVVDELSASLRRARAAGIPSTRLAVDPGLGFGKRLEDNLALLCHAGWLRRQLELPLLVGPSRKSFLGALTGDPVEQRDTATAAACCVAVFAGADALRVHDVAGGVRAARIGSALREARQEGRG